MAGRHRKHPTDAHRLSFKASHEDATVFEWYIEWLNAHAPVDEHGERPHFDKQAVLASMFAEYRKQRASLFAAAVEWVRKGRKPPKEG